MSAGGGSSGSGSHDHHDLESVLSGVRSQSITTPIRPVQTSIILESNPSVILNKKTLRNYTPRESSCLLRQFEEERLYSGRDHKRLGLDLETDQLSSPQFSSLTSRKSRVGGQATRDTREVDMNTCTSNVSQWSAASFDWHAGSVKRDDNAGWSERSSPGGAPALSPGRRSSHDSKTEQKQCKMEQSELDNDDDGLGNLRQLLKEGKIVGLNDKPPAFIPPSPPASKSANGKMKPKAPASKGQASPSKGPSKLSENKNRKHDKRLAPPPPTLNNDHQFHTPTPSSTVQFLGGRRVQSVENICADLGQVDRDPRHEAAGADLKRSTSIHAQNAKGRPCLLMMGDNYSLARCTLQLHVAFFRISWQIFPSKGFLIGPTHCRLHGKEISLQQFIQEYLEKEAIQPGRLLNSKNQPFITNL